MNISRDEMLQRQLKASLDPHLNLNRLIPVGPHELETMISEKLNLQPGWVPCPELPYSAAQLRDLTEQLEEEESHAVLTLDLPEIGGHLTDLHHLAEWFGYPDQRETFGKVHKGLLNLNVHISNSRLSSLAKAMGTVSQLPQWRIRYLNLLPWGAGLTYADQAREVQKRGYNVPSAISDCWSMLIARLFMIHCGGDMVMRADHCGRTATPYQGNPIVIYNLQFRLGLDIGLGVGQDRADGATYVCCEVPPR